MVTKELYPSALTLELLLSPEHNVEKMKESLCLTGQQGNREHALT